MALKFLFQPESNTECILWERNESLEDLKCFLPESLHASLLQQYPQSASRRKEKLDVLCALERQWKLADKLEKKANGSPVLRNDPRHISISHSKQYVAIGLSSKHPIGVDVEDLNRPIEHLAERYLHPDEFDLFPTKTLKTLAWSMKEAIYKCVQQEGLDFRKGIRLQALNPINPETLMLNSNSFSGVYATHAEAYFKNRKYSLTLVCLLYAQQSYAISWLSELN